jgi:hypothetical protein
MRLNIVYRWSLKKKKKKMIRMDIDYDTLTRIQIELKYGTKEKALEMLTNAMQNASDKRK